MKYHDLNKMFETLTDYDTDTDMARVSVYDAKTGDVIFFALGLGGYDDDSGANSELAQLLDRMRETCSLNELQNLLETLPDKYAITVEGISISE